MESLYLGYTLADFLGFVSDGAVTYQECSRLLEEELMCRFPWINPDEFYPHIKKKSVDQEDYCCQLIRAGKRLEKMLL